MILFINSSNRGTVKAVSPWFGLQIMPLIIKLARSGPNESVGFSKRVAISPEPPSKPRCQRGQLQARNPDLRHIFILDLEGFGSAIDKIGAPFYSPEALDAYRRVLKTSLSPTIRVVELDANINDEGFALVAADLLMESLGASMETKAARSPKCSDALIGPDKRDSRHLTPRSSANSE
jgi:hypothetical protein